MKKFVFALVALLVAVGMAAPVMAEDRLSLAGSMQVRGFGYDFEEDDGTTK
ncbi:hypothetical protein GWN28_15300, partial [candidate division KSB1 bacterium]|nr:hypothetical protein [candidate division KSB1 bacterium]NIV70267.1 hypothetical protein [Phycisphaerae bacterium]NIW19697.1 hypothetical protein [candidate division KSB1 bacterium]NIW73181.1 hypothetical protein [candidate division KSB1 bacterium]